MYPTHSQSIQEKKKEIFMSITRVYRDRDNNIKVEKFSFQEVKKDLTKFFSHDNGISNRKDKNDNKKIIKDTIKY